MPITIRTHLLPLVASVLILTGCPNAGASGDGDTNDGDPIPLGLGTGITYYLSDRGNDSDTGTSPETAWQSLGRLSSVSLQGGDAVLLERGSVFRIPEDSSSGLHPSGGDETAWVRYGTYGSGDRPIILGSVDLSEPEDWESVGPDLWRSSSHLVADVGQVYLDGDATTAAKTWSVGEISKTGDFFTDLDGGVITMAAPGNPGTIYQHIEAALSRHLVNQGGLAYAVFESIHFRYGGAHGFGGANSHHIVIRDCEFSFIGGGFLAGTTDSQGRPVRYGNAIEFWGNAWNHLVENNVIHDIYDTALTNQNHGATVVQRNIIYRDNDIENCGLASFELWVRPESSRVSRISFVGNTCVNPGSGWGRDRSDANSYQVALFSNVGRTEDILIAENLFQTTVDPTETGYSLLYFESNPSDHYGSDFILRDNTWYSVAENPDGALWVFGYDSETAIYRGYESFVQTTGFDKGGSWVEP